MPEYKKPTRPSRLSKLFMNVSFIILAIAVAFIAAKLLLPVILTETALPNVQKKLCTYSITRSLMINSDEQCQSRSTL
jgi:hypothetical protein